MVLFVVLKCFTYKYFSFNNYIGLGPRVKVASCKSALNPPVVYSTDRSKAVVPVLVLLFVALWFILRGDLFYVLPCVILFLCFSVLLALRLPRLGKRELILVLFVRLSDMCLFGFVGFLFLLVSGKGCCLWLWHSLDFSLTFFWDEFSRVAALFGKGLPTLLGIYSFCGCLFVLVWLSLLCLELDVGWIVTAPEFTCLLYVYILKIQTA